MHTSYKAFAFGIGATLALGLSIHQQQMNTERAAAVKTLEPVVINIKRGASAAAEVKRLPTVYITGRRSDAAAQDEALAVWSGGLPRIV